MKTCITCKNEKALNEFYFLNRSKGTRRSDCIPCRKESRKKSWENGSEKASNYAAKKRNYQRNQDYVWSVLIASKCADCGNDNPIVLEFDHVRGQKLYDITKLVSSNYGLDKIKAEVAKCEVVCANCHKTRTTTRAGHWRLQRLTQT